MSTQVDLVLVDDLRRFREGVGATPSRFAPSPAVDSVMGTAVRNAIAERGVTLDAELVDEIVMAATVAAGDLIRRW